MNDIAKQLRDEGSDLSLYAARSIEELRAMNDGLNAAVTKLGNIINNGFPSPWEYLKLWVSRKLARND